MKKSSILPKLPGAPGVYIMKNSTAQIIYIGKARDLKKRVASYFSKKHHDGKTLALVSDIRHVDYVPTASEREALILERRLIARYKPIYNIMWKDDKSYPYLALSLHEDFPRLYLTRPKIKIPGCLYFGPYPSVKKVKQLLRWIWRHKLFALRPCKYQFDENNLLTYQKVKSCLYLHTGECPAPCIGKISRRNYRKISSQAKWFFEGKQKKVLQQWQREMKRYSKTREFEKAAVRRDLIKTIQHMQEPVTFREMTERVLKGRIQGSRAVQGIMRALHLSKPPERIECFDISHIQGTEKVASMVSFLNGRPNKSQYRKFIIKSVQGIDDFKSMAEVVGRRVRRLKKEEKPFPDLILVDGGKGQLNAALTSINHEKLGSIAIAALAKEQEEIFLPGRLKSIRLPLDSPELLLLRHIRDEAHRFAIQFHRQRRGKMALAEAISNKIT